MEQQYYQLHRWSTHLELYGSSCEELPEDLFADYIEITHLQLGLPLLKRLPHSINCLQQLKSITISCVVMDWNEKLQLLYQLPKLSEVNFLQVSGIIRPSALLPIVNLTKLYVSLNNIEDIVGMVQALPQLRQLIVKSDLSVFNRIITPALLSEVRQLDRLILAIARHDLDALPKDTLQAMIATGKPVKLIMQQKIFRVSNKEILTKLDKYGVSITTDKNDSGALVVIGANSMLHASAYLEKAIRIISVDQLQATLLDEEDLPLRRNTDPKVNSELLRMLISTDKEDTLQALTRIQKEGANSILQSAVAALWRAHPDKDIRAISNRLYRRFGSDSFRVYAHRINTVFFDTPVYNHEKLRKLSSHPDVDPVIFILTVIHLVRRQFQSGSNTYLENGQRTTSRRKKVYTLPSIKMIEDQWNNMPEEATVFMSEDKGR
ncbi:leucine-rich repeat domain-containing protein [Chitinophaga rhizophila]|uniref:Leucine rich repeat (LRR) protein n=1 Tax=Chitinophaga rhizophila TaxID=2866212 RepID=A0ABS7GKV8_9BACT|nr:hypothetical protein [Chitinophaga rhizophila]MBW8687755.1 hypothetical protein [Chitinophaga rhizophila]